MNVSLNVNNYSVINKSRVKTYARVMTQNELSIKLPEKETFSDSEKFLTHLGLHVDFYA